MSRDEKVTLSGQHYTDVSVLTDRLEAWIVYEQLRPEYKTSERLQGEVQAMQALHSLCKQLNRKGVWITAEDEVMRIATKAVSDYGLEMELYEQD